MLDSIPIEGERHQQDSPLDAMGSVPDATQRTPAPPAAPDGGFQAWMQVLAAHLVLMNTFVS